MLQLSFSVKAQATQKQHIKIVGSIPQLGNWKPENAMSLSNKKGIWQGSTFQTKFGNKFEFKVIKVDEKNVVQWEQLPNDSNRKFKPKCPSQLHLQWSKPFGKVTPLTRGTYKVKGLPGVCINILNTVINKPKFLENKGAKKQQFDPYRNARDQESEQSDQQEFLLVRRKMSDQILINSGDLEQIYYKNSSLEIFCGLLKKIKIYVISRELDLNIALHASIEQQLTNLPQNYLARWMTADYLLGKQHSGLHVKMKKRGSLFDIGRQELHLESLYSRTSYFIILQLQTALMLSDKIGLVPTCLLLPANKYKETIQALPRLSKIQLICFDEPAANKEFYQYLKSKSSQLNRQDSITTVTVTAPSIKHIIDQLLRLRYRETVILNTLESISEKEGLSIISQQNTVCILDAGIIQNFKEFSEKLIEQVSQHSLLIIISKGQMSQRVLDLRTEKNIVLVYQNFQKIILQGKQYHPLRNFRETIDMFKMKSQLYTQSYGGEITYRQSAIIYTLPEGKQEWAMKVQAECRTVERKYGIIKVTRKGTRVKVGWSLAKEIRLIRTVCEIKYMNFGALGNFNLVTEEMNFKELKDDIKLLIQHVPKLFQNSNSTNVNYYSFGGNQSSSLTIIPTVEEK